MGSWGKGRGKTSLIRLWRRRGVSHEALMSHPPVQLLLSPSPSPGCLRGYRSSSAAPSVAADHHSNSPIEYYTWDIATKLPITGDSALMRPHPHLPPPVDCVLLHLSAANEKGHDGDPDSLGCLSVHIRQF